MNIGEKVIQIESRSIVDILRQWWIAGIDLVFPSRCAGCGQYGSVWCEGCHQSLLKITKPICYTCGSSTGKPVRHCQHCGDYPEGLQVRSYARYQGPLLKAILFLKYRPNRDLAFTMAAWLLDICSQARMPPSLVVPVPLGRRRLQSRGYNQAGMIAEALAELLGLEFRENAIRRIRETSSQVGLDHRARYLNVENAFSATADCVNDQRILLVDDLVTTGSTLSACAIALLDAGASKVVGLAVARA